MLSSETRFFKILVQATFTFYIALSVAVSAADEKVLGTAGGNKKGYSKGDLVPVSCLNRTMYMSLSSLELHLPANIGD
jgi:hypothetical protein